MSYAHTPVLLKEVVEYLYPQPGQNIVDATLGGGGYTKEILNHVGPKGKVLAIDMDPVAIENIKDQTAKVKNLTAVHGNFRDIDKILEHQKFYNISGIVADIGLSSYQLDQSGRGITFQKKEPLDMRFDVSSTEDDAAFLINNKTEQELTGIFKNYGEEKFSWQIAKKIVRARQEKAIKHTNELYEIITESLPKPVRHKAADSARRVFQALRIAVNHELDNLKMFLPKAFDLLNPGGRMVIVSFHSLEDRMVKQFFSELNKGCVCPPDFPYCICGKRPRGKLLTKKAVTAGEKELAANLRARAAKLRAIMKISS